MNLRLEPPPVARRWEGETVIVAASGPSLTKEAGASCKGHHTIAVNDAWKLVPTADILYACDAKWWEFNNGCPRFKGEKWSSHHPDERGKSKNDKTEQFVKFKLHVVSGLVGEPGFSYDQSAIHYGAIEKNKGFGHNSGFQAVNLAILFGASVIVLIGFDMQRANGKAHFFGDHEGGLVKHSPYDQFVAAFDAAAPHVPNNITIINCTPGSALKCFPKMRLSKALSGTSAGLFRKENTRELSSVASVP